MAGPSVFDRLRRLFTARTAVREIRDNPALKATVSRASEIYTETPLAGLLDDSAKSALSRQLYLELNDICNATEPKAACRDKLVRSMLQFAPLQVVMIPPPPTTDDSGLRALPGITGELRPRLSELIDTDTDLRCGIAADQSGETADAAQQALSRSYWANYWFVETFNAARIELGDNVGVADWYRPFLHAACVSQEHAFRRELNLPPAFDEDVAQVVVTAFSIYTDVVVSGAEDPDREWHAYCERAGVPQLDRSANTWRV